MLVFMNMQGQLICRAILRGDIYRRNERQRFRKNHGIVDSEIFQHAVIATQGSLNGHILRRLAQRCDVALGPYSVAVYRRIYPSWLWR